MSTETKTIADFKTEFEEQLSILPRPLRNALAYGATLENTESSEEEEEEETVPPGKKRKKQVRPEGTKKGEYYKEVLTKASELSEVKETLVALLDYVMQLESQQ
ncbi:MAG: hypothetical protein HRU41_40065 [Saprospiraceae bacterium]|nr:hypothetical protein [Saprospiraceae bacterium]